jgi:hypothetical protein
MESIEELRARLRGMTNDQLKGYGVVAKIMCSCSLNSDKPPRECFRKQLSEARAEWNRRHPEDDMRWLDVIEQTCAACGTPVSVKTGVSIPSITGQTVMVHKECVSDFVNRQAKAG